MTTEERDARLTAYALNDPGLTAADRTEIEAALQADVAARRAVEETRTLANLLTTGLAAEQAALPAEAPVAIPSSVTPSRRPNGAWRRLAQYAVAASILLLAVPLTYALFKNTNQVREASVRGKAENERRERELAANRSLDGVPADYGDGRADSLRSAQSSVTLMGAPPGPIPAGPLNPGYAADPDGNATRGTIRPATTPGFSATPGGTGPGFGGGGFQGGGGGSPGRPGGPPGGGSLPGIGSGTARPNDYSTPPGAGPVPSEGSPATQPGTDYFEKPSSSNDRHMSLVENQFVTVEGQAALSTFGVDVDTASYAIVRKYLSMGSLPPANAVRLEELVNYFPYADKAPDGDNPFAVTVELAECPWQPRHRLARIGLKAKPVANDKRPPSNLVFLIDVSGSMSGPNRLPLVKASLRMLVNQLGENDRVAMVVYAGTTGLVLDSTSAMHKDRILGALDRLEAGGSTNGSGGIQQAYAVATANFIKGGTNRIVLCTDGDWNVGTTSTTDLVKMVEEKRKTGVFLSVFGFGMGNLRDEMMVQLAGKGNGNYAYIDTLKEANKALVEQLGGTLVTVAKDVKIQVEFNPAIVKAYRLLGYEKRALAAKDFHDDKKDAGEMGAGHVVTALYELVPSGVAAPGQGKVDGLRYQPGPEPKPAVKSNESFVVKMRHKKPDSDVSTLRELPVTDPGKGYAEASEDFRFAAAVASFAMLLRNSPHKGETTFALVQELAEAARKHDPSGYRAEFVEMIRQAKTLSGKP